MGHIVTTYQVYRESQMRAYYFLTSLRLCKLGVCLLCFLLNLSFLIVFITDMLSLYIHHVLCFYDIIHYRFAVQSHFTDNEDESDED